MENKKSKAGVLKLDGQITKLQLLLEAKNAANNLLAENVGSLKA